jgi:hypothetical protein
MATTTPNFGWPVPTSTDLVKDGATAIEALGDSIDASLLDLKGGTTGQVLSKNSNTDMDFTWVTSDDANAIQNTIVDAKGDLIAATAADTPARLAVGTNGHVLTADSTAATGIKWAAPASGGGMTLINTGGTTLSGSTTTVSTIPGTYKQLVVYLQDFNQGSNGDVTVVLNSDTTDTNYITSTTWGSNGTGSYINMVNNCKAGDNQNFAVLVIPDYADTTHYKMYQEQVTFIRTDTSARVSGLGNVTWLNTAAITSIGFRLGSGTWTSGTILVYGVN